MSPNPYTAAVVAFVGCLIGFELVAPVHLYLAPAGALVAIAAFSGLISLCSALVVAIGRGP